MTSIYVGNLSYQLTEDELKEVFVRFGGVESVKIITDRFSGDSKGFGFVEMPSETEAEHAIKELDGSPLKGRNLRVNVARPRERGRPPRQHRG